MNQSTAIFSEIPTREVNLHSGLSKTQGAELLEPEAGTHKGQPRAAVALPPFGHPQAGDTKLPKWQDESIQECLGKTGGICKPFLGE